MEEYKLFDAEYKFLSVIWENEPVKSTELSRICLDKLGWKKSTVFNMIRKLSDRGFVKNDKSIVTSLVKRECVAKYESEAVVEKSFGGSLPAFIAAFLDGRRLTPEEAERLKALIDQSTGESGE